jgi:hypothetical protein
MTPRIHFPLSEEQLLAIYQQHFPDEPYDTERGLAVLRFAGDVAYASWYNGATTMQGLYEQRERKVEQKRGM